MLVPKGPEYQQTLRAAKAKRTQESQQVRYTTFVIGGDHKSPEEKRIDKGMRAAFKRLHTGNTGQ